MPVAFLLNSLHSVGYLWVEEDLHLFTNGNWCLHGFGFLVDLQSSHAFPCSPRLVGVEIEVDRAKVLLLK